MVPEHAGRIAKPAEGMDDLVGGDAEDARVGRDHAHEVGDHMPVVLTHVEELHDRAPVAAGPLGLVPEIAGEIVELAGTVPALRAGVVAPSSDHASLVSSVAFNRRARGRFDERKPAGEGGGAEGRVAAPSGARTR